MIMKIETARTDDEILATFPVMKQLRPHVSESAFLEAVHRMEKESYGLLCLLAPDTRAVAGFRYMEMLAMGKILYVDDLVTAPEHRSAGYGKALLDRLKTLAAEQGCRVLVLDSGVKRVDAHRFYRRHGLEDIGHHFAIPVDGGPQWKSE